MATYWTDSSVGFAPQSAFGTENTTAGDFKYLKAEAPTVSLDTEVSELELMEGQVGAAAERIIGRRSGTISMTMPLEGFKDGYDPTAENPGSTGVTPHIMALVANATGSHASNWVGGVNTSAQFWTGEQHISNSSYVAAGVASATGTVITYDAAPTQIKGGQYVATGLTATTTDVQTGFAKTKAASDVTLFETATHTVNDNAANAYGTATSYQSDDQPIPLTIRWKGQNAAFGYRLIDCIAESFTVNLNAAETPTIEITYRFYNFIADKTIGGLETPDSFERVPTILGTSNGRVTINGSVFCGLEDVSIGWSAGDLRTVVCHSQNSGIESVQIIRPVVTATFSVPHKSTDTIYDAGGSSANSGAHVW